MSMQEWRVYGYGFDVGETTLEEYTAFIHAHNVDGKFDDVVEVINDIKENEEEDDWIEVIDGHYDKLSEPIAQIITMETGIPMDCPGITEREEDPCIFTKAYPWEFSDKVKNMSEEKLCDILKRYARELGVNFYENCDYVYYG